MRISLLTELWIGGWTNTKREEKIFLTYLVQRGLCQLLCAFLSVWLGESRAHLPQLCTALALVWQTKIRPGKLSCSVPDSLISVWKPHNFLHFTCGTLKTWSCSLNTDLMWVCLLLDVVLDFILMCSFPLRSSQAPSLQSVVNQWASNLHYWPK